MQRWTLLLQNCFGLEVRKHVGCETLSPGKNWDKTHFDPNRKWRYRRKGVCGSTHSLSTDLTSYFSSSARAIRARSVLKKIRPLCIRWAPKSENRPTASNLSQIALDSYQVSPFAAKHGNEKVYVLVVRSLHLWDSLVLAGLFFSLYRNIMPSFNYLRPHVNSIGLVSIDIRVGLYW